VLRAVLALLIFWPSLASAQLSLRESRVVQGSYAVVGNQLIDCPSGTCDNNTSAMIPVDIDALALGDLDGDGDDDTTMSAAATLEIPPGAIVRSASLYLISLGSNATADYQGPAWASNDPLDHPLLFSSAGAPYATMTATSVDLLNGGLGYLARYEVTSLVTSAGEYTVANAMEVPATHPWNRILSWTLFVTYEDGSPPQLVNLYDGTLNCFQNSTTISLASFRTPATGAPVARFTSCSVDGAPQFPGESIRVGALMVSNSENPANNLGNATVSSPAGPIPRNPSSFLVTEEIDIDTFDVSSAFVASQTSVDVTFTCGNLEGVIYHLAALSIGVVAPILEVTKSVTDADGGETVSGDELIYELTVRTLSGDDAIDVVLRDPLPDGATYVPESIEYLGAVTSTQSDAAGDDLAELAGDALIFRVGAGATSTTGGTLAVGAEARVRFRAIVETATAAFTVENRAFASALGAQAGAGQTRIEVASNPPGGTGATIIDAVPCAGFMDGCPDAGFPDSGEEDAAAADAGADPDAEVIADAAAPDAAPDAAADGGAPVDAGRDATPDSGTPTDDEDEDGCACSSHRGDRSSAWLGLTAMILLALRPRRRR
jgi:uncharacterized repeat protein (TIGR01451 family)/MYXO-CTERM domain-containing protein